MKDKKTITLSWLMVIAGALLIIWAGYTILNEFTHFAEPEPLRSELRSGKIGRFYPTSTLIMIWGAWIVWTGIGAGVLYSGIKRIKRLRVKSDEPRT